MRKILSLVMALAMLLGMCSFASADEVVTLEWYVLEGPAPGNQMVWDAINEYMASAITRERILRIGSFLLVFCVISSSRPTHRAALKTM